MKAVYKAKVFGDVDFQPVKQAGEIAGTLGECRKIEALVVSVDWEGPVSANLGVSYKGMFEEVGWTASVANGECLDSQGRQLECVSISLFGDDADKYDIVYRSHSEDFGWLNWTKNGGASGVEGKRLEAIQIYIGPRDSLFFEVGNLSPFLPQDEPVTAMPIEEGEGEDSMRRRICDIAYSYVGYEAGSGNYSIFGERFGDPYGEWCAYFVRSVFEDAGLGDLVPETGYCPYVKDWFLSHETACFYSNVSGYVPKPGDIVLFDYNENGTPDHVGIVDGSDGVVITTIEGNTGDPRAVRLKNSYYYVDQSDVHGYCVPDYQGRQ